MKKNPTWLHSTVLSIVLYLFSYSCGLSQKIDNPTPSPDSILTKKTQLLVRSTWQVDEVFRSISGMNSHYKSGGENTTGTDYDTIQVTLNTDGSGTYRDEDRDNPPGYMVVRYTSDFRNLLHLVLALRQQQLINWGLFEVTG